MNKNFGIKPSESDGGCCAPSKPKGDGKSYPTICFRDQHAKLLEGVVGEPLDVGDEVTATVTFKVTGVRNDEYGQSTDLSLVSMDGSETGDTQGESEADTEDAGMSDSAESEDSAETPAPKKAKVKLDLNPKA